MRWADVQPHRAAPTSAAIDPAKVRVLVSPSMRRAKHWCLDHDLPDPSTRGGMKAGAPLVVTNMDNAQRMRGLEFEADAELVILDRMAVRLNVIEEAERNFEVCKMRASRATRRGATRTVIPRGESELSY